MIVKKPDDIIATIVFRCRSPRKVAPQEIVLNEFLSALGTEQVVSISASQRLAMDNGITNVTMTMKSRGLKNMVDRVGPKNDMKQTHKVSLTRSRAMKKAWETRKRNYGPSGYKCGHGPGRHGYPKKTDA